MAAVSRFQQQHGHGNSQHQPTSMRPATSAGLRTSTSNSIYGATASASAAASSTLPALYHTNSSGNNNNNLSPSRSDYFPSLPGFSRDRPHTQQGGPRNQSLNFINGFMMVNSPLPPSRGGGGTGSTMSMLSPPSSPSSISNARPMTASSHIRPSTSPNDVTGRYSFYRQKADRSNNRRPLPFSPSSKLPAFLEHDRRVLLFHAYYEEDVLESPVESKRTTKCEIYFFVEDGTIEIVQTKQENSGVPQGVFLRRSRVEKPRQGASSSSMSGGSLYYEIDDLKIGNQVEIYSRTFNIVNCNESTKRYVIEAQGWHEVDVAPLPFPHDSYAELNKVKMSRESGVPGIDRKRKMNDLKQVMECMLGKPTAVADRGAFLECGQDTLCFHVVWDDRKRLYGDMQFFSLFYYLADDTFEILPLHNKNDGRDQFPKLLKRCKLPRPRGPDARERGTTAAAAAAAAAGGGHGSGTSNEYYTWRDLAIGEQISIFGRPMLLARCDTFTRQHYASKGVEMNPDLALKQEEEKVRVERQIPPYNGFGSEEDSLRSCTGLHSPPPKKDLAKMREKSGVVLRYNAHLLSDKIEDHSRRFVIQFFMEDDTMAIREPPIQNSGVMGGNFLRRQAVKKPDGSRYEPGDMYVGNVVDISGHRFVLLNADEYSYRLMENDHRAFPYSDFTRLRNTLTEHKDSIKNYFVTNYNGDGKIDKSQLEKCLRTVGLNWNKQEIITLWRKLDKRGKGKVSFTKLVKAASSNDPMSPTRKKRLG